MMSTKQPAATSMADVLLQLVDFEIIIFLVLGFLVASFVSSKSLKSLKRKPSCAEQLEDASAGRITSPGKTRQPRHCPELGQALAPSPALSHKVELLIQCAERHQDADAIAIFEEIKATSENTAFQDALQHRFFSNVFRKVACQQRPVEVFTLLAQCAGRIGRMELIDVFLEDMTRAGIKRPLAFYDSMMTMLASKECHKQAMSIGSLLESDGLEPSPFILSCLLRSAVALDNSDHAISFFNRLAASRGGAPSIHDYTVILQVHSKRQNWPTCVALLRDMQEQQTPIDSYVLNIVLATGVAAGELQATKALAQEFSLIGIADVISYNTVIFSQ